MRFDWGFRRGGETAGAGVGTTTLGERLGQILIGPVVINISFYVGYPREDGWTDGIRLEHPDTGEMLFGTDEYPYQWLQAGIRDLAVVGLPYHPTCQGPQFAVGQYVRLVPEPNNPKDRRAIAVRSVDGRVLAGYVPADCLDEVRAIAPPPQVGIVIWDHYEGPPRQRVGMCVLAAPVIELRMVPPGYEEAERSRRAAFYAAGGQTGMLARQQLQASRRERVPDQPAKRVPGADQRGARLATLAQRRGSGVCITCGRAVPPDPSGRPQVRCPNCRLES